MWFGSIKKASAILASRLNKKNVLEQEVKVSYFRTRESTFLQYFQGNSSFVFCHNIPGLLKELGLSIYNPNEWWMFIDSSKQSLESFYTMAICLVQPLLGIQSVFMKNMEM